MCRVCGQLPGRGPASSALPEPIRTALRQTSRVRMSAGISFSAVLRASVRARPGRHRCRRPLPVIPRHLQLSPSSRTASRLHRPARSLRLRTAGAGRKAPGRGLQRRRAGKAGPAGAPWQCREDSMAMDAPGQRSTAPVDGAGGRTGLRNLEEEWSCSACRTRLPAERPEPAEWLALQGRTAPRRTKGALRGVSVSSSRAGPSPRACPGGPSCRRCR